MGRSLIGKTDPFLLLLLTRHIPISPRLCLTVAGGKNQHTHTHKDIPKQDLRVWLYYSNPIKRKSSARETSWVLVPLLLPLQDSNYICILLINHFLNRHTHTLEIRRSPPICILLLQLFTTLKVFQLLHISLSKKTVLIAPLSKQFEIHSSLFVLPHTSKGFQSLFSPAAASFFRVFHPLLKSDPFRCESRVWLWQAERIFRPKSKKFSLIESGIRTLSL